MGDTPIPVVRLRAAVVQYVPGTTTTVGVNVDGSFPPVWWPAGYIPTPGDPVKVLMVDGTAVVHSPVISGQRPLTGTVADVPTNGYVPVTTTEAGTILCRYTGTAPTVGTLVRLDWQATTPWVWPTTPSTTTPPTLPGGGGGPTPPPTSLTGTLSVASGDSGSWSAQGWSSFHGTDLTQGAWSGGSAYTGAWFYGSAPQQIAGRTVTGFRLRLGARRRIGNYNSSVGLNIYRTANSTRPGGDVSRVEGPVTVTLAANAPAQWVALPTAWGQAIVNGGGGIGIAGGTYAGVVGVGGDPASGQLEFDWRT